METKGVALSSEWKKISDGKKNYDIQAVTGSALFCFSEEQPVVETGSHFLEQGKWVSVKPPYVAWFREFTTGALIAVTECAVS